MKTFQTSTQIAPIVSVGTYWGWFEYESLWSLQEEDAREEGRFVCDDYSHRKLGDAIVETANEVFEQEKPFADVGVRSIRATGFGSPREYNFCDDWLDLEFEVDDDFFDRAEARILAPENRGVVEKYIEENWCSRDGFTSFMPCTRDNGRWGEPGKRYEDPDVDGLREVFKALKGELELPECDAWRWFGGVIAILHAVEGGEAPQDDDFYGTLTGVLFERFVENHSLGDFCTVMDPDEAEAKYPGVKALLALPAGEKKALEGTLAKYLASDVPPEAKKRAEEEVEARARALDKFAHDVREAVEWNHPREDAVNDRLAELAREWTETFGGPAAAKAGDLPGQAELDFGGFDELSRVEWAAAVAASALGVAPPPPCYLPEGGGVVVDLAARDVDPGKFADAMRPDLDGTGLRAAPADGRVVRVTREAGA